MTADEMIIDYEALIDEAMYMIVQKALVIASKSGLPGGHHFYITFQTQHPGVDIPPHLKKKYPDEMTIVLQYQFHSLVVSDDKFSVVLSFNNIPETLTIPFGSIISFADPSVQFGLQFRRVALDEESEEWEHEHTAEVKEFTPKAKPIEKGKTKAENAKKGKADGKKGKSKSDAKEPKKGSKKTDEKKESAKIVSLDSFRKK